jgi:hypothetical protein
MNHSETIFGPPNFLSSHCSLKDSGSVAMGWNDERSKVFVVGGLRSLGSPPRDWLQAYGRPNKTISQKLHDKLKKLSARNDEQNSVSNCQFS